MIRVLIADDHAVVRLGLRRVLVEVEDMSLVGEAGDAWETLDKLRTCVVDVLLLDLTMPGATGFDLIKAVKAEARYVAILVVSMHADPHVAEHAFTAGAHGYLTKGAVPELLIAAIRTVYQGARFIDPGLMGSSALAGWGSRTQ